MPETTHVVLPRMRYVGMILLCCFHVFERESSFLLRINATKNVIVSTLSPYGAIGIDAQSMFLFSSGGESQMPNAKVLNEKQVIVAGLTEKLKGAASGVFVDYKGITVSEDTALRSELRKNDVDYGVVKNTLTRFAIKNVGLDELDPILNGTTSLAVSTTDPIAPMRVVNTFAKKLGENKFNIKGGFMDGKVLSLAEISTLADLPSKEVLLAQVLGTMLAPITSLAIVLKAISEKDGAPVEAAAE